MRQRKHDRTWSSISKTIKTHYLFVAILALLCIIGLYPFLLWIDTARVLPVPRRPIILCWIATSATDPNATIPLKLTWTRKCDKLLFMSTISDVSVPTVRLNVTEGYSFLWGKTKAAFQYVYKHHFNDADWFLKADDDVFIIMENLREYLQQFQPSDPLHLGFQYKLRLEYMSGGAGYILSKAALRKFVQEAIPKPTLCSPAPIGVEDAEMGRCLTNVGVKQVDARDSLMRLKFFPMKLWIWDPHSSQGTGKTAHIVKRGEKCCSDKPISFHDLSPDQIYLIEYLLYHVKRSF